ncbi:hypothetical protein C4D60_Mb06t07240 [Musa balbisiana]|uniref:Uncharacterized protein n=1 Tax=Musa balbisiana TaxID=52838 RepID=A0A4S8ILZ7_MUSBA|nr:hypothetical protein C4D60_Mb06t07240 [Musa balbisiana]
MKTEDVVLGVEILHHDCLNVMMGSIQLILMNLCACSMEILQVLANVMSKYSFNICCRFV